MEYKEILEGLRDDGVFGFVSNNYWKLSKDVLVNIIKELDYAAYDNLTKKEYTEITEAMLEELTDIWEE